MARRIVIIGAGFGGLSAAGLLARQGHDVTVVEQLDHAGGRATVWAKDGFTFDLGPSWYLMPDVYQRYFHRMGTSAEAELDLRRLSPSYRVYFGARDVVDVPADLDATLALFDTFEPGGAGKLRRYLDQAAYQYDVAMNEFVYRDYKRLSDFFSRRMLVEGTKLKVFTNLDRYVRTYFTSDRARKVLEYSMVFLGGAPDNTPALYNIMSHVDLVMGVWYPMGGMGAVVRAMQRLAEAAGARFLFDRPVRRIVVRDGRATGVETDEGVIDADIVLANADYHHVETRLLEPRHRQYSARYWETRVIAPSAFVLYLGLDRPVDGLAHHTLFLQHDWMKHFNTIFKRPAWPDRPSYYVCAASKTDPTVAPEGTENIFVLVPVAAGLEDTDAGRERFATMILDDLEAQIGETIRDHIVVRRSFAHRDFSARYNAYKGTALGLAHTLRQTALFRPRHKSKALEGVYFTGHYTHPGVGVPMTLISSQLVAEEIGTE
jgi:1-hydroxy-2-isopentenylcarotenoid 3,4-desaturase